MPERRALAQRLGLRAEAPDECSAAARSTSRSSASRARRRSRAAVDAVAARGSVVLIGIWADEIPLPVSEVVGRETRIAGSYGYSQREFADVTAWVGSGEVDLSPIIERRVGFDDVIGAFAAYADGSLDAVRTLLQPGLMNFELPDDVQRLVAIAREFREERLDPLEAEFLREGNVPWPLRPKLQAEARERGLWAIDVPHEHGGLGLGQLAVCAVHEELNRHPMMFETGGAPEPALYDCSPAAVGPLLRGGRRAASVAAHTRSPSRGPGPISARSPRPPCATATTG